MDLAGLNALPPAEAVQALRTCCAAETWAERMAARRPFPDASGLLAAAEEVWWDLDSADWMEAFAAHPRLGERADGDDRSSRWSRGEQAGVDDADADTRRRLDECNRAYEDRFGYRFIAFATGETADDLLQACRDRLGNDEVRELTVAATEQARITNLRLRRLVGMA
jgi:OHCU decarboxylase